MKELDQPLSIYVQNLVEEGKSRIAGWGDTPSLKNFHQVVVIPAIAKLEPTVRVFRNSSKSERKDLEEFSCIAEMVADYDALVALSVELAEAIFKHAGKNPILPPRTAVS